jgi:hypothetical protein
MRDELGHLVRCRNKSGHCGINSNLFLSNTSVDVNNLPFNESEQFLIRGCNLQLYWSIIVNAHIVYSF